MSRELEAAGAEDTKRVVRAGAGEAEGSDGDKSHGPIQ